MLGNLWRSLFGGAGSNTEATAGRTLVLPASRDDATSATQASPSAMDPGTGSIFFVGNATVIIRYCGFTIMTDPNFLHKGDHAHLGFGLYTTRETDPVVELEDVGHVDLVLLSHMHDDHFDRTVEERLNKVRVRLLSSTHIAIPIVTTHHAARTLSSRGFVSTHALVTWETIAITREGSPYVLKITAMPARHAPGMLHHLSLLPQTMGSMLQFGMLPEGTERRAPSDGGHESPVPPAMAATLDPVLVLRNARVPTPGGGRYPDLPDPTAGNALLALPIFSLYISGDTLVHDDLAEIPRRFPDVDVALLHLGGTRILGLVVTMDAAQGVECVRIINATKSIPIHFKDYTAFKSRLDDFRAAVHTANLDDRVHFIEYGDTYHFEVPAVRLQAAAGSRSLDHLAD